MNANNRFSAYESASPVQVTSVATRTFSNLASGYNLLVDNANFELLPGDLIMITGLNGTSIAVDSSGTASQSDYELNSNNLIRLDPNKNMRFYIRAIVSPFLKVKTKTKSSPIFLAFVMF